MSGVEAGATIVGLVGFGLTSLKAFYQFISSVKDGPEKVRDLANDLKSLQAAYERIQALGDLPGIFASSPSLPDLLKDCNESIGKLQKKIGKLQVRPNDKFHGVVWKRLKMAFNDDEIAQALAVLSGYVGKITLEISVIDLRLVHQNAGHVSQLVAGGERHFTMAKQQHSMLEKIGTDMNSFIPQIQQFKNGINTVAVKITSMQSSSLGQAAEIIARLERLEKGFDSMSLQNKTPANSIAVDDNSCLVPQEETENSAILASIQNLCALVDRQERHIESDEAQNIIEDLDTLLQDLQSSKTNLQHAVISSDAAEGLVNQKEFSRDVRRFRGIVSSSTEVTLNHSKANRHDLVGCVGRINQSVHTWTQHKSKHGHWIISTRKQWRGNASTDGGKTLEDLTAHVLFKPRSRHSQVLVKATVRQFQRLHGFYSFAPSVTVSRIRPRSSKVFECVRFGDMTGLLQLLVSGEASLQDRDDKGASLLHYAFEEPEMIQFLTEHGADPDDVARCTHLWNRIVSGGGTWSRVIATPLHLSSESANMSSRAKNSFKTLLEAGADPTIEMRLNLEGSPESVELWHTLLLYDLYDAFDDLFQQGGHFMNVQTNGMLHDCCENSQHQEIQTLIKHGANVDARNSVGQTSLHYLVSRLRRVNGSVESDRASLVCLINSGADIHSRDNAGQSIWDAAMHNRQSGSCARDMWDFALVYCGYISEMEAFTRDNPRHAVYCKSKGGYSRADFEEIWEGWEHLRPYYYDEESGLDCASFKSVTPPQSTLSSTSYSMSTTSSMWIGDITDIDQTPPNQQQDLSEDEASPGLPEETIDRLTQESDREEHSCMDNSCSEDCRLTEDRVASLGDFHLDESVKTWLSKSSVSSDMSDSSSVASLQHLGSTEVGFSEEVYENPWAEG